MTRFLIARLAYAVPVLLLASLVVFSMLQLVPGDPVDAMLGSADSGMSGAARAESVARIRAELGLNDPLPLQYLRWVVNAAHGDLGTSYVRRQPVAEIIAQRLPSTAELAFAALVISTLLGVGLGVAAALQRGSAADAFVLLVSLGGISTPNFFLAMLLILVFSVGLGWVPATGAGGLDRLMLPALALGYESTALVTRLTRAAVLDVLRAEYVRTAHAKGLARSAVVTRHVLRNAAIPILTATGLQVGHLLAGSVIIETVFARQGIGQLAIEAILGKDFPLVQGIVLLTATMFVLANLLVDISYGYLDPRLRAEG